MVLPGTVGAVVKKRTILWDWTLTRDCETTPGIQESASHREKGREGMLDVEFHPWLPLMATAGSAR